MVTAVHPGCGCPAAAGGDAGAATFEDVSSNASMIGFVGELLLSTNRLCLFTENRLILHAAAEVSELQLVDLTLGTHADDRTRTALQGGSIEERLVADIGSLWTGTCAFFLTSLLFTFFLSSGPCAAAAAVLRDEVSARIMCQALSEQEAVML